MWVWDKTLPQSISQELISRAYAGPVELNLSDGVALTDFQSGRLADLKFSYLELIDSQDELHWLPHFTKGAYQIGQKDYNVFSDYSWIGMVDPDEVTNGHWRRELHEDCLINTISAAIYKRLQNRIESHIRYHYVDSFTGLDNEFIVTEFNQIEFSTDQELDVGVLISGMGPTETRGGGEFHYYGNESGRLCFLKYFPVVNVQVFTIQGLTVTEWEQVDDFSGTTQIDTHFMVDQDLGIVRIGGFELPDLVLEENVGLGDETIYVYPDKTLLDQYPEQGILLINSEYIYYTNKGVGYFSGLTRGALGSTVATHTSSTTVAWEPQGLVLDETHEIYIAYSAVPRIEYEVTDYQLRTGVNYNYLNLRPMFNYSHNAILQLRMDESHVSSLLLETSSTLIGSNLYGPLYFGTDISRLKCTALDQEGNPVADVFITLEIIEGEGLLDSTPQLVSKYSNSAGFIRANLTVPYDEDSISQKVTSVTYSGGNTEVVLDIKPNVSPDDVWVYQVLKIDKTLGTVGMKSTINAVTVSASPYGDQIITLDDLYTEDIKGGVFNVIGTDSILYQREIKHIFQTTYAGEPVTNIYIEGAITGALILGQGCWILEPEAVSWDETELNGTNVILYNYDAGATHPISGTGAWVPVHPDLVELNKLTFNSTLLPQPDPSDLDTNLGAYLFVFPTQLKLRAYCQDPATGNTIYSNVIRMFVDIPLILKGYSDGIPYGFSLISESFNAGTALGGANFITINPLATGINQLGMSLEVV